MNLDDELLQRYRIEKLLGQGGMGAVYLAHDKVLDQKVAIKSLLPEVVHDSRSLEQLKREVRTSQSLRHENICATYHLEVSGQEPFIVMEYVEGRTLSNFIFTQPNHRCSEATFRNLAVQILAAIQAAHRAGIVHRDLKTANVMVTEENGVRVMDFGIAANLKELHARTTGASVSLSIHYASPEQINGDPPSPLMDIYSLGCVMYEMLAGHPPFVHGDVLHQQLSREVPPIADIRPEWNALLAGCLRKNPKKRIQRIDEISKGLGVELTVRLPKVPSRPAKHTRLAFALLSVAALSAIGGTALWHHSKTSGPAVKGEPSAVKGTPDRFVNEEIPSGPQKQDPLQPMSKPTRERPRLPEDPQSEKPVVHRVKTWEQIRTEVRGLMDAGKYDEAIGLLRSAQVNDDGNPEIRGLLGRVIAAKETEEGGRK